jgi:hypothetical protein
VFFFGCRGYRVERLVEIGDKKVMHFPDSPIILAADKDLNLYLLFELFKPVGY